jgi:hypothetical protein
MATANKTVTAYAHLAMSAAVLTKSIKDIASTGKKFDALVHKTGVACIIASLPELDGGFGDANRALQMVQALPSGASRGRVVQWLHHFSNIRITAKQSEDKKSFTWAVKMLKPGKPATETKPATADDVGYNANVDPNAANATPFWDLNVDRNMAEFIFGDDYLAKALANIVKKFDAAKASGNVDPAMTSADIAIIEGLRKQADTVQKRAQGLAAQRAKAAQIEAVHSVAA